MALREVKLAVVVPGAWQWERVGNEAFHTGKTEPSCWQRGRIWRKALQESCEHTRGLMLGLQRAQRHPRALQGEWDGAGAGSSVTAAGREVLVGL